MLREHRSSEAAKAGDAHLEIRYGLIQVEIGGEPVTVSYAADAHGEIGAVVVEAQEGSVCFRGLQCVGLPQPVLTPEQRAHLRRGGQLRTAVAGLYRAGRFEEALPLAKEALDISREVVGEGHPYYATALSEMALLQAEMGEYAKAEPLFRQAAEIRRKVLGEEHPDLRHEL